MFELCASILAADFAHLARDVQAADAAGADAFHIDIMDGHFVPAISFGTGMVRTMRGLTRKPLDVHLMVETPLDFVRNWPPWAWSEFRSTTRFRAGRDLPCRPSAPPGCSPGWC